MYIFGNCNSIKEIKKIKEISFIFSINSIYYFKFRDMKLSRIDYYVKCGSETEREEVLETQWGTRNRKHPKIDDKFIEFWISWKPIKEMQYKNFNFNLKLRIEKVTRRKQTKTGEQLVIPGKWNSENMKEKKRLKKV